MKRHFFFKFEITFTPKKVTETSPITWGGVFPNSEYATAALKVHFGHLDDFEFRVIIAEKIDHMVLEHEIDKLWYEG